MPCSGCFRLAWSEFQLIKNKKQKEFIITNFEKRFWSNNKNYSLKVDNQKHDIYSGTT